MSVTQQSTKLVLGPFTFANRPAPMPADLRISWRLPLLILILLGCRQGRSSIRKLHVISWFIRSDQLRSQLVRILDGTGADLNSAMALDPALDLALDLAVGEQLVKRRSGKVVELTDKGRDLGQAIIAHDDVFVPERRFLSDLGRKLTDSWVDGFLRTRRI
jgi:hypothetical protein